MIILDDEEEQFPKIATPLPVHTRTNRPSTPTPSLPDYDESQEHVRTGKWKKKPMSKRMKWTLWGLGAYFVVTVAIGVPLIVVKTRSDKDTYKSPTSMLYPTPSNANSSNSSDPPVFNLGAFPVCVESASSCDVWSVVDRFDGARYNAHLEYYVPLADTIFVQSNMTYVKSNVTLPITGSLNVGVGSESSETRATFKVDMSYSGTDIRERTSVCMMNLNGSDGLYIYVPSNLTSPDLLSFNISLLFPSSRGKPPIYVPNFLTSLPYFSQNLSSITPQITFGNVALGGYKASVSVDSLQAEAVLLRSPFADVSGTFNLTNDDDESSDGDRDGDDKTDTS